mmetsp:Transcript_69499/g.137455  ORF Transcript_69499/g.137455 Transcript_69499/m.137455 type:complete len:356 (+) Transcript_69499:11-1078(+)
MGVVRPVPQARAMYSDRTAVLMPLWPTCLCSLPFLLKTVCGPTRAYADEVGDGFDAATSVAATAAMHPSVEAATTLPVLSRDSIQAATILLPQASLDAMGSTSTAVAAAKVRLPILRGATGNSSSSGVRNVYSSMWVKAGTWTDLSHTPHWLTGHCNAVWSSSFAKYRLPYHVDFGNASPYHRWAHDTGGYGRENYGIGTFMSPLHTTIHLDGGWETSYFVASRFIPDATNSTNCCCEYVTQDPGRPRVLADYCAAVVPHSAHLPLREVCAPHVRHCPLDTTVALAEIGPPFVEIYSPCTPIDESPTSTANQRGVLQFCLVLLVALMAVRQLGYMLVHTMHAWTLANRSLTEHLL